MNIRELKAVVKELNSKPDIIANIHHEDLSNKIIINN